MGWCMPHEGSAMDTPGNTERWAPLPEQPLVTIVTPSFNQRRFVEATIRSVLDQDYPAIEYIVKDGGSVDGTVELLRSYGDRLTGHLGRMAGRRPQSMPAGAREMGRSWPG